VRARGMIDISVENRAFLLPHCRDDPTPSCFFARKDYIKTHHF